MHFTDFALSHHGPNGAVAFVSDCSTPATSFHLLYAGDTSNSLSRGPQLVNVPLARSCNAPALPGFHLVGTDHTAPGFPAGEHLVERCSQLLSMASAAELEPGDLAPPFPLLHTYVKTILHDTRAPAPLCYITSELHIQISEPVTAPPVDSGESVSPLIVPRYLEPFIHHLRGETSPQPMCLTPPGAMVYQVYDYGHA